jgi:hypothetical protein
VLLILGTNKQSTEPKLTNTHNGNLHGLLPVLHQSDRWPAPVRPVTPVRQVGKAGQAGGYSSYTKMFQRAPVTFLGLGTETPQNTTCKEEERYTKPSKTTLKRPRADQQQHNPKTHGTSNSPKANSSKGSHRSDRSRAPVRPVTPWQLGMNNTCRSTSPNPTPDLSIHSTDLHKTLGIVGTPHGHSIAKLWSTKTR